MTEPLAAKKKAASEESLSTFWYDDVEASAAAGQSPKEVGQSDSKPGHKRKLTSADLNKPLPPVLMKVPFKIEVDRSFSWNRLGSVRGSLGSSRVESGMVWPLPDGPRTSRG